MTNHFLGTASMIFYNFEDLLTLDMSLTRKTTFLWHAYEPTITREWTDNSKTYFVWSVAQLVLDLLQKNLFVQV